MISCTPFSIRYHIPKYKMSYFLTASFGVMCGKSSTLPGKSRSPSRSRIVYIGPRNCQMMLLHTVCSSWAIIGRSIMVHVAQLPCCDAQHSGDLVDLPSPLRFQDIGGNSPIPTHLDSAGFPQHCSFGALGE